MTLLPSSVGITAIGNMIAPGASGSTSSDLTAATGTVTCRMTYSLGRRSLILGPLIWARMMKPFSSSSSRSRASAARGASETIIAARQAPMRGMLVGVLGRRVRRTQVLDDLVRLAVDLVAVDEHRGAVLAGDRHELRPCPRGPRGR